MSLESLLGALCRFLTAAEVPFMLTGSVAAGYRGASRATMDVDAVIDPNQQQLDDFLERAASADLYVSVDAARDALRTRGMFNVIDPQSGWKADLIIRKARAFSASEFARREAVTMLGIPLSIVSLEDLVVAKLEWAALGGSARQLEDVRALLRINSPNVDRVYIERWIAPLGLESVWDAVRDSGAT